MKKLLPLLIGLSLSGLSFLSHAENLLQVYQQARESNPDLLRTRAAMNAAYEKINQSRGTLLPQLGLNGSYNINRGYRDNSGADTNTASGNVGLTQTLFNMSQWRNLTITQQQAGIEDIVYQAQEQTLILEVARAYFNVLNALDTLSFTAAEKSSIGQQLEQTKQRFNVGLVAITDVYTAQAQYDQTLANEVTARNALDNAVEALRQVTGVHYTQLGSLDTKRFSTQPPNDVNALLKEAENSNLSLISARLTQELTREQIRLAQAGHLPTLDLNVSTGLTNNRNKGNNKFVVNPSTGSLYSRDTTGGNTAAGVTLSIPLYTGGQTNSLVKQAQFNYVGASEALEGAHRSVVMNTRSSFNNISASISTVVAYRQSVISAESSLEATKAGYSVGTRTIVDVLNATTALYNAKTLLANARYTYLINQLNIKLALGTLNEQDLVMLNNDLGAPVATSPMMVTN